MQIPVLVERVKGNGYRARGTEPFAISAKGSTREEALAKLDAERKLVDANRELIARMEKKIQAKLAEIWGEPAEVSA
jgi:hypothetical protein